MKSSKGFATLEALKNEMDEQRRAEEKARLDEMQKRKNALMEKAGFESPEEMIDYLMSGKKIVDREGQSFRLVDGMVEAIYEIYDEYAGPQGYGKKYQTLATFKKFVYGVLNKHKIESGDKWLPTWVKENYFEYL